MGELEESGVDFLSFYQFLAVKFFFGLWFLSFLFLSADLLHSSDRLLVF